MREDDVNRQRACCASCFRGVVREQVGGILDIADQFARLAPECGTQFHQRRKTHATHLARAEQRQVRLADADDPLCAILATSLLTQIEYRNNAWKQVHTMPLSLAHVFFSKLGVVFVMLGQFFVLFNVGIWLSDFLPYALVAGVPFPAGPIPLMDFLRQDALYFVDCLPIVALQYAIGLRFGNFLVSVGMGFLLWIGALAALAWKYGYLIPYICVTLDYLRQVPAARQPIPTWTYTYSCSDISSSHRRRLRDVRQSTPEGMSRLGR
jgi:hypothetical protein